MTGCWRPGAWPLDNYWSSPFGNMFLSRKGFLGAPASIDKGTVECVASTNATVRFGGVFAPLVRFEALCEPPACVAGGYAGGGAAVCAWCDAPYPNESSNS